nr:DNA-directed DNA polymerase [Tanacetum cinerariifolium]
MYYGQLLQAPTEGYEDVIVVPAITADNFEVNHDLFTLVQNKQFFGHDNEDPHAHVRYFNKITSTLKFLNHFDESFIEAWDRFKDLLRAYPNHGFSKSHQLDTFYNSLNSKDQDSLNSIAGGNFLDKIPHECLAIIESKSKVRYLRNKPVVAKVSTNTSTSGISPNVAKLKDMVKALLLDKKSQNQSPAPVKAFKESSVTFDGAHSYRNCPATDGNPLVFQPPAYQALAPQTQGVSKEDFSAYVKANDAVMRNMQTQDLGAIINLMPFSVWKRLSLPYLTPTCMTIKLADRSISRPVGVAKDVYVKVGDHSLRPEELLLMCSKPYLDLEGDILLLEAFLNDDPSLPPPNHGNYMPEVRKELKICKSKSDKSSVDEPPVVELKDLPPHLEYALLEGDDKLPVIIAKDLSVEEKTALITVLKSHKRGIAWKLFDIKGIDPEFCTHKTLIEEDFEPAIRRKPHSPTHMERLLIAACLLGYAMLQEFFLKLSLPFRKDAEEAKVDVITKLPHPTTIKGIRSFLGHAGFYRLFIKDFSKIARPMTRLLEKDTPFIFSQEYVEAFQTLKRKLTKASILIAPDWDMPFEFMCDANDFAIGAVLGQRQDKHFRPIHYASKTMTEAKSNYTTTKKEMLAVVYAFEKYQSYLITNKSIEFTFKVIDTKGVENLATDHLSRVENPHKNVLDPKEINESFPFETLNLTSVQVEVSNRSLKHILKRAVVENRASYLDKLDDALWAICTAYKIPIGCTLYKLVYGKACHLPVKLEHKAYWALKHENFDLKTVGDHRKVQINELNKLRDQAYEKTKKLHDSKIKNCVFNIGDRVLLFKSRLKIFSGKLKSRWSGPFTISQVYPYGTVKLSQPDGINFKVNGHRLKHYFREDIPKMVVPDLQTFSMDH